MHSLCSLQWDGWYWAVWAPQETAGLANYRWQEKRDPLQTKLISHTLLLLCQTFQNPFFQNRTQSHAAGEDVREWNEMEYWTEIFVVWCRRVRRWRSEDLTTHAAMEWYRDGNELSSILQLFSWRLHMVGARDERMSEKSDQMEFG